MLGRWFFFPSTTLAPRCPCHQTNNPRQPDTQRANAPRARTPSHPIGGSSEFFSLRDKSQTPCGVFIQKHQTCAAPAERNLKVGHVHRVADGVRVADAAIPHTNPCSFGVLIVFSFSFSLSSLSIWLLRCRWRFCPLPLRPVSLVIDVGAAAAALAVMILL